jgi:hypothetical protein
VMALVVHEHEVGPLGIFERIGHARPLLEWVLSSDLTARLVWLC